MSIKWKEKKKHTHNQLKWTALPFANAFISRGSNKISFWFQKKYFFCHWLFSIKTNNSVRMILVWIKNRKLKTNRIHLWCKEWMNEINLSMSISISVCWTESVCLIKTYRILWKIVTRDSNVTMTVTE